MHARTPLLVAAAAALAPVSSSSSLGPDLLRDGRRVEMPMSVAVVSGDELSGNGNVDVASLTALVPGVVAVAASPSALLGSRFGAEGSQPGITIDGVFDVLEARGAGRTLAQTTLGGSGSLGQIERIEVLRGPQGTHFGLDAGAGVNIVTKKAEDGEGVSMDIDLQSAWVRDDEKFGGPFTSYRNARSRMRVAGNEVFVFGGFGDPEEGFGATPAAQLSAGNPLGQLLASPSYAKGSTDLYLVVSAVSGDATNPTYDLRFAEVSRDVFPSSWEEYAVDPRYLPRYSDMWMNAAVGLKKGGLGSLTSQLGVSGTTPVRPLAATDEGGSSTIRFGFDPKAGSELARGTGLQLDLTPRIGTNGGVVLDIASQATMPFWRPGQIQLGTREIRTTVAVEPGETVAIGGLLRSGVGDAASVPGLSRVPLIGGLFAGRNGNERRNLIVFITPQVVGEDGSSGGGGGIASGLDEDSPAYHDHAPLEPSRLGIDVKFLRTDQSLPDFNWLRTENGGQILRRPLISESTDVDGATIGASVSYGLDRSYFGGRDPRWTLRASYFDADEEYTTPFVSAGGNALGIEDPNGSGFLVGAGNGDVENVVFDVGYRAAMIALQYAETRRHCSSSSLSIGGGLRYYNTDYTAALRGRTNSGTLDILREDEVDHWSAGPAFELELSHRFRGNWLAYAGVDLTAGYGSADGRSRIVVGAFPERARDLDDSKLTYSAGLRGGASYERDDWSVGFELGLEQGNRYPTIEYQPMGPAELDFANERNWFVGLTARARY